LADLEVSELNADFTRLDWVLLLVPAVIWGMSFLLMAEGLEAFNPGLVTFFRVGFGFVAVLMMAPRRTEFAPEHRLHLAAIGFFWLAFPLTLFPIAQQWIDSSVAGMLNSAMPLATALVGWAIFSTPTRGVQLAGVLVGFVGILIIGVPTATTDSTSALGVILIVLAVCCYGIAINLAVPMQQTYGAAPVLRRALAVACVLCAPYGLYGLSQSTYSSSSLAACVVLGLLGTGVAYVMAATLAGRVGAVRTSIITYIVPIVAVSAGVIFRDEMLSWWAVLGTTVVLFGALLSTRSAASGAKART
jgi:drug/metabolite transporter (DMT)-like permease